MCCSDCIQCLGADNYKLKNAVTAIDHVWDQVRQKWHWCGYLTVSWSKTWSQHWESEFCHILKMKLNMLVYFYYFLNILCVHTSLLLHTLLPPPPFTPSLPHLFDKLIFPDPDGTAPLFKKSILNVIFSASQTL